VRRFTHGSPRRTLDGGEFLFSSRVRRSPHLSTRQYARIVKSWASLIGLDPHEYGTHTLRRTKVTLIYRRTKNLRAVQLLLGHRKLESTVRYLGIEADDALQMAEQTEVDPIGLTIHSVARDIVKWTPKTGQLAK